MSDNKKPEESKASIPVKQGFQPPAAFKNFKIQGRFGAPAANRGFNPSTFKTQHKG